MNIRPYVAALLLAILAGCTLAARNPESAIEIYVARWELIDGGPDVNVTFQVRNTGDSDAWAIKLHTLSTYVASPYVFDRAVVKDGKSPFMNPSLFASDEVLPAGYQIERSLFLDFDMEKSSRSEGGNMPGPFPHYSLRFMLEYVTDERAWYFSLGECNMHPDGQRIEGPECHSDIFYPRWGEWSERPANATFVGERVPTDAT